jgi:hypothetical protein
MQSMIGDRFNVNLSQAHRGSMKLFSHVPHVLIRIVNSMLPDGFTTLLRI